MKDTAVDNFEDAAAAAAKFTHFNNSKEVSVVKPEANNKKETAVAATKFGATDDEIEPPAVDNHIKLTVNNKKLLPTSLKSQTPPLNLKLPTTRNKPLLLSWEPSMTRKKLSAPSGR